MGGKVPYYASDMALVNVLREIAYGYGPIPNTTVNEYERDVASRDDWLPRPRTADGCRQVRSRGLHP